MRWRLDNVLFLVAVILASIVATLEFQPRPEPPPASFAEQRQMPIVEPRPAPAPVPLAWRRFGQLFQDQLKALLEANNAQAEEVRSFLKTQAARTGGTRSALLVHVWIGADGKVQRVEFPALADRQADKALHEILAQGNVSHPPADMPQPLVMKLALDW